MILYNHNNICHRNYIQIICIADGEKFRMFFDGNSLCLLYTVKCREKITADMTTVNTSKMEI